MNRLFLLSLLSTILFGMSISSSYEEAHKQALQEHKILLVLLARKGHAASKKAMKKIIADKKTVALIQKHTIFVIVYENKKQSYPVEMLYTNSIPALFFLDENELFICSTLKGTIELKEIKNCLR